MVQGSASLNRADRRLSQIGRWLLGLCYRRWHWGL